MNLPRPVPAILNRYIDWRFNRLIREVDGPEPYVTRRIVVTRSFAIRYAPRRAQRFRWTSGDGTTLTASSEAFQSALDRIRDDGFNVRIEGSDSA